MMIKSTVNRTAVIWAIIAIVFLVLGLNDTASAGPSSSNEDVSCVEPRGMSQLWSQHENMDAMCIALTVYHEARGEPDAGQWAVARVITNRMVDPAWRTESACDVVWAPGQFDWTRDQLCNYPADLMSKEWIKAWSIAVSVWEERVEWRSKNPVLYFMNPGASSPAGRKWIERNTSHVKTIGRHEFYGNQTDGTPFHSKWDNWTVRQYDMRMFRLNIESLAVQMKMDWLLDHYSRHLERARVCERRSAVGRWWSGCKAELWAHLPAVPN